MDIGKLLVGGLSKVWEWISDNLWPAAQKSIAEFCFTMLDKVYSALAKIVFDTIKKQADKAESEAKSADEQAANTEAKDEVILLTQTAESLRRKAKEYMEIYSELEEKFAVHKSRMKSEVAEDIGKMDINSVLKNARQSPGIDIKQTPVPESKQS